AMSGIMPTVARLRATQISLGRFPYPRASAFISSFVAAHLFDGLTHGSQAFWNGIFLWAHSLLVLAFLVYLGYSKHLHIITAPFNVFFSSTASRPRGALPRVDVYSEDIGDADVTVTSTAPAMPSKPLP